MKKRIPSFLTGMLTMALICSLAIPVLASAGMTITVDPINIQVNGSTFQPKDVKGNSVPVFAYNGTTYAPLRALAEAYGLEVGYDSNTNMATVAEPGTTPTTPAAPSTDYSKWSAEEEAAYQEFKGMCDITITPDGLYGDRKTKVYCGVELTLSETTQYNVDYHYSLNETANLSTTEQVAYWNQNLKAAQEKFAKRLTEEKSEENSRKNTAVVFRWKDLTVMVTVLYGDAEYAIEIRV